MKRLTSGFHHTVSPPLSERCIAKLQVVLGNKCPVPWLPSPPPPAELTWALLWATDVGWPISSSSLKCFHSTPCCPERPSSLEHHRPRTLSPRLLRLWDQTAAGQRASRSEQFRKEQLKCLWALLDLASLWGERVLGGLLSPKSPAPVRAPGVGGPTESPSKSRRLSKHCCQLDLIWFLSKERCWL